MKEENKKKSLVLNLTKIEVLIFLGFGVILILLPLLFTWKDISWISFKGYGEIGDTIGGVTAPFLSFFGSILVYLALKAQIDANEKINEQFKIQRIIDYQQNFENTFFSMLNIHHDIVKNIDFLPGKIISNDEKLLGYFVEFYKHFDLRTEIVDNEVLESRDVFKFAEIYLYAILYEDLYVESLLDFPKFEDEITKSAYMNSLNNMRTIFNKISKPLLTSKQISFNGVSKTTKFNDIYDLVYFKLSTDFGHYFRNLYRIIKMVDEKEFSKNDIEDFKIKYSYTSIIRAQLSDDEIKWLFFNGLSDKGSEKFKPLLEKYSMLKIINEADPVFSFYLPLYYKSAINNPSDNNVKSHLEHFKIKD